jgi:5-methylcytosine-specific restriction protein A
MRLKMLGPSVPILETQRLPLLDSTSWRSGKDGANARGYTYQWQQARKAFLSLHPLCQCPDCDEGRIRARAATVVDHREPHRGDQEKFWRRSNWMAMAKPCHDAKTQRERK